MRIQDHCSAAKVRELPIELCQQETEINKVLHEKFPFFILHSFKSISLFKLINALKVNDDKKLN